MNNNYNSKNQFANFNHSKELSEINSRLDHYISSVKDLTKNGTNSKPAQNTPFNYFNHGTVQPNSSSNNNSMQQNSILGSVKSLERDLEIFKQL